MRKERNSGPAEADGSKARGEKVNCIRVLCENEILDVDNSTKSEKPRIQAVFCSNKLI